MRVARSRLIAVSLALLAAGARAQEPSDESVLGTVVVDGSAGGQFLPPLPKLAVIPIITESNTDSTLQSVTRRDLELSGQFDVLESAKIPGGPHMRDSAIEWDAWDKTKVEYLVRVFADKSGNDRYELIAEAFVAPVKPKTTKGKVEEEPHPTAPVKPAYTNRIASSEREVRLNMHRLVDALLGGLTGRPGGFASQIAFTARVGRWTQIFVSDADGFNLHSVGPNAHTVMTPTFGPGNELFYVISENFHRFRIAQGSNASHFPMLIKDWASVTSIVFSDDRKRFAISTWNDGDGAIWVSDPTGQNLNRVSKEPYANFPAIGPQGQVAWAAGKDVQRIYVDGKPISPPGFNASSPTFCDTPEGLFVLMTVGIGAGSDVIAIDPATKRIKRLTQRTGANRYPACSPDGRLVAFFSHTKVGKGAGLYIAPILRPMMAKKISEEVGDGLRWESIDVP